MVSRADSISRTTSPRPLRPTPAWFGRKKMTDLCLVPMTPLHLPYTSYPRLSWLTSRILLCKDAAKQEYFFMLRKINHLDARLFPRSEAKNALRRDYAPV